MIFKFYCGPNDKWTPEALLAGLKLLTEANHFVEEQFYVDKIVWTLMTRYRGHIRKEIVGVPQPQYSVFSVTKQIFSIIPAVVMGKIECQVWLHEDIQLDVVEILTRLENEQT